MSSREENLNLEFRKIPSLQFLYEVNSNGTIIRNVKSKRHLKLFLKCGHVSNTRYWCTQVNIKHHVRKVFVHRVVAECWYGPRPEGMQVDHIDQNSLNNDYRNLRYVTKSEQMLNRTIPPESMDKMLSNLALCNGGVKRQPVMLVSADETLYFWSVRKACAFLAEKYGVPWKTPQHKFRIRRSHVYDYDVIYLNAETACSNQNTTGKEQSTQYLVGTLDRWNDAKRAEEHDRVKHTL